MPKVSQEHRDARKREIIAAAIRVFARQGFQETSIADIIAESGLSAGAIYGYYTSKDEIIHSAIVELLDLRFTTVSGRGAGPTMIPPGEMMGLFLTSLGDEMGDLGLLVQVWGQAVLDPTSRVAADRIGEHLKQLWREYLLAWYRDALALEDAGDWAQRFAPLYLGITQGYILQSTVFGRFDAAGYLEAASAIRPAVGHLDLGSPDWDT